MLMLKPEIDGGGKMKSALKVSNLSKSYTDFELKNVSLEVPQGKIMGLIGENGAGKSTIINSILNLLHRDSGTVEFWGEEFNSETIKTKENIGVVMDGVNFYETLTAKKIEKILLAIYKQWDSKVYFEYMRKFALPLDKEIKKLSKGMKVKLCIAAALSHHPKFLILDEATSGLDPVMRDDILEVFQGFVADGKGAILLSSHISTDIEKIADYITFIHEGKLIFSKPKIEIYGDYGSIRGDERLLKRLHEQVIAYRKINDGFEMLIDNKGKVLKKYPDLTVSDITIDEILLFYIKGEQCI